MQSHWGNFLIELGVLSFFGVLYYLFQRKKILQYEDRKIPITMQFILEACLAEKKDFPQKHLDDLIISIDDYLKDTTRIPPFSLLKSYEQSSDCSLELKKIIQIGLLEMGIDD